MNKIKFLAIVEIIIGIVIVLSFNKLHNIKNHISSTNTQFQTKLSSCEEGRKLLFDRWRCELNSNETVLKDDIFLEDDNFCKTTIKKVCKGKPKIVFRITDDVSSCNDCKSKIFSRLKILGEQIGLDNIIIIGRYAKMRDLIIAKEQENINYKIYNYNKDLNIYADRSNKIDYLFVLDENLSTKLTFVATNVTMEKIDTYFKKVNNWFVNNSQSIIDIKLR